MKLISGKHEKKYANQQVVLPVVGKVKFDEEGCLSIDDADVADALISATEESFDFYVEKELEEQVELKQENVESKKPAKNSKGKSKSSEINEIKKQLKQMSKEDLYELAKEAKLGSPEKIASMTDGLIINNLAKKMVETE